MNRKASVTMKDGRPVLMTMMTVDDSRPPGRSRRPAGSDAQTGRPYWVDGNGDDHAGEADHRAERQVELAGDHQQAGADGDDAELGRHLHPVDDSLGREHTGVGRDESEKDEDQNGSGQGAELRTAEKPLDRGFSAHPFIRLRRRDIGRRGVIQWLRHGRLFPGLHVWVRGFKQVRIGKPGGSRSASRSLRSAHGTGQLLDLTDVVLGHKAGAGQHIPAGQQAVTGV